MRTSTTVGRCLGLGLAAGLLLVVPVLGGPQSEGQNNPFVLERRDRLSIPVAATLRERGVLPVYSYRHATFKGRELNANQYGATAALGKELDVSFDWRDIEALGRTKGNRFDGESWGFEFRYAPRVWHWAETTAGVQFDYRRVDGLAKTSDTLVIPPDATLVTFSGLVSHRLTARQTLHGRLLYQHSSLGPVLDGGTVGLGVGVDHSLGRDVSLEGNLGYFAESGDADGSELALSGGLHYGGPTGWIFDLQGTYLPGGIPLAGDPLTDAAVFRMDPIIATQNAVQSFQDDGVGFLTVQVGYRHEF